MLLKGLLAALTRSTAFHLLPSVVVPARDLKVAALIGTLLVLAIHPL
jgi:hypothetical protein